MEMRASWLLSYRDAKPYLTVVKVSHRLSWCYKHRQIRIGSRKQKLSSAVLLAPPTKYHTVCPFRMVNEGEQPFDRLPQIRGHVAKTEQEDECVWKNWELLRKLPPTAKLSSPFQEASRPHSIIKSETYHFSIHSAMSMVQTYLSACNITSLLARLWR